jgi:uncharacterized protein YqcC (DUF446 family)
MGVGVVVHGVYTGLCILQFDFFQLVLVPIMHEILATERQTNNNKQINPCASSRYQIENTEMWNTSI